MSSTGSYEDLFRKEIAKYDHICREIGQNIEAQEQLLLQIQVGIFLQFLNCFCTCASFLFSFIFET